MLNSNEIRKLLEELPLEGSFIQKVTEHDYHSFTFSLFSKSEKAWLMYFEIGTSSQHFCRTSVMRKKSGRTQRFTQYLRANVVGSRIMSVEQVEGERVFCMTLSHTGITRRLHFRYFSGAGANVIVTDDDNIILELLMRRPRRGEERGMAYIQPEAKAWDEEHFPVREYDGDSFNNYIDRFYREADQREQREDALSALEGQREKELSALSAQIRDVRTRIEKSAGYLSYKETGDILSSSSHLLKAGMDSVTLDDFSGGSVTVQLDPTLSPSGNISSYYQKYKRGQRIHENAVQELRQLEDRLEERTRYYDRLLGGDESSLTELKGAVARPSQNDRRQTSGPGLRFESQGFAIIVGRNAKENDSILRSVARSNDTWLHVRDFAGGYVIIKGKKDKSIPLDVLLDAGSLAIHYSRAKGRSKVDLYYTLVKHLRRIKDGRTGLVTPTQEKNLCITVDEERLKRLLLSGKEDAK